MASDGSGQDPLANMQNLMGYAGLVDPNTYLSFQGKLPFGNDVPGGGQGFGQYYTGVGGNMPPTNAQGQPIQSFVNANTMAQQQYQQQMAAYQKALAAYNAGGSTPGKTINSPPNAYGTSTPNLSQGIYSAMPAGGYGSTMAAAADPSQYSAATQGAMAQYPGSIPLSAFSGGTGGGNQNQQDAAGLAALMGLNPQNLNGMGAVYNTPAASSGPAAPTAPSQPNMRQAYLDALSNPGPLQQYGANPPQAGQTRTGSVQTPSVMTAFLNANQGKPTPYTNVLNQLNRATA